MFFSKCQGPAQRLSCLDHKRGEERTGRELLRSARSLPLRRRNGIIIDKVQPERAASGQGLLSGQQRQRTALRLAMCCSF